ncbi:disease resistance protein RPV1 isoform X2 [Jatropha curcas]|uniref:disease resistance protein RPV1 isoform X2 n=1 Tax=Jatropha curcas TaxID=180498 RepID=UPI001894EF49|nr:disease resistance protein RPV1 isoform X2 [Jatropha curcas]
MAAASSSSTSSQLKNQEVFINFRGKDIRDGFLSFLFESLKQKGIDTFKDENLQKGAEITPALKRTIQESYISIVIFSENYADSPWCLDELVVINECRERSGQIVLPVFYRIDPTDVQELTGPFAKALARLLQDHSDSSRNFVGWCHALKTISNDLSGWVSNEIKNDRLLVERIVDCVWEILSHMPSSTSYEDKLVGIDWRAEEVKLLLDIKANDRRSVGIWGMAGIGKTTLAGEVFTQIMAKFDAHYFVSNVKEQIRKKTAIVVRDKIIRALLGDENLKLGTPCLDTWIVRRLRRKKVLIGFDDVDDPKELDDLVGDCCLYREGSRIIITSTDKQVLQSVCEEEHIYEAQKLMDHEALQLFSLHAFHQNDPKEGYVELSKEVITYAEGNPLGITVLGSSLYRKKIEDWESQLLKLKSIPNKKIQDVLRVSYDGLDRHDQDIFLDIACFFKGELKDEVENILESFGFFARSGIRNLVDKSLVTISSGVVDMHNLLQQMGKEIVNGEWKQPGGRSRLWMSADISHVFKTNTGTDKIECISLDMSEIGPIELDSTAFMEMHYLRFLKIYKCDSSERYILPTGLDFLPQLLRYLYWDHYPLKSLPLKFCPNNLVGLHLPHSQLKQLWAADDKPLGNLKVMDLKNSESLIRIPNSFEAPNLEKLYLSKCESLVEIPSSLENSSRLALIDLEGCESICSLPSFIQLENLEFLNLKHCSKLEECPEVPCNIRFLYLNRTAIKQLPLSIGHCSRLVTLSLWGTELENLPNCIGKLKSLVRLTLVKCSKLSCLPQSICQLKSLEEIEVTDCLKLNGLPDNLGDLKSLMKLAAAGSGIKILPSSINQLSKLEYLCCEGCKRLTTLPPLSGLNCLRNLFLSKCSILEIPESIGSLISLESLYLDGNDFKSIPASIKLLFKLNTLQLNDCKRLRNLPQLPCSRIFSASNCISLEFVSCPFLSLEDEDEDGEAYVEHDDFLKMDGQCLDFSNCIKLDENVRIEIMETLLSAYPEKEIMYSWDGSSTQHEISDEWMWISYFIRAGER